MSMQVHGVVEHSADHEDVAVAPADEQMSRPIDPASGSAGTTQGEVPREYARTQLRPRRDSAVVTERGGITDCCDDQCFIALAGLLAELLRGPRG